MNDLDNSLTNMEWLRKVNKSNSQLALAAQQQDHEQHTKDTIDMTIEQMKAQVAKTTGRPTFSYSTLIAIAIRSSRKGKITLGEIYQWIMDNFPYYRTAAPSWKNSIRHNLSFNKLFIRVPREASDPGKGAYWAINPKTDPERRHSRGGGESSDFSSEQPSPDVMTEEASSERLTRPVEPMMSSLNGGMLMMSKIPTYEYANVDRPLNIIPRQRPQLRVDATLQTQNPDYFASFRANIGQITGSTASSAQSVLFDTEPVTADGTRTNPLYLPKIDSRNPIAVEDEEEFDYSSLV